MPDQANLAAVLAGTNPQAYSQYIQKQQALLRNQKIAQMLQEQSVAPVENETITGHTVKYGVGQGLTKLAQALLANHMNTQNDQAVGEQGAMQGQLMGQYMKQYAAMLSGQPQQAPQDQQAPASTSQQPMQPSGPPNGPTASAVPVAQQGADLPNNSVAQSTPYQPGMEALGQQGERLKAAGVYGGFGGLVGADEALKAGFSAQNAAMTPNDFGRELAMATPDQRQAALTAKFTPTVVGRDGIPITQGPNGPVINSDLAAQIGQLRATNEGRDAAAKAPYELTEVPLKDGSTIMATRADAAMFAGLTPEQFRYAMGIPASKQADREALANAFRSDNAGQPALFKVSGPSTNLAQDGQQFTPTPISSLTGKPSPVAQAQQTAINAADTEALNKSWTTQQAANQQAQPIKSYLAEISRLGPDAISNPNSDWISKVLATIAPVNAAADKTLSAVQLIDKYQGQIVQRLSSMGMNTDSARSIVEASTPGNHMTANARAEAVANLMGSYDMVQARTQAMLPYVQRNDRKGVDAATTQFDSVADPRVFALQHMTKGQANAYFMTLTPAQTKELQTRAAALHSMGVL